MAESSSNRSVYALGIRLGAFLGEPIKKEEHAVKRFLAKLLFQYRVAKTGRNTRRRWCEERTITFEERSPQRAIVYARKVGRGAAFSFRNQDNQTVSFEFVGIVDMIALGLECEIGEVWYDVFQLVAPDEREDQFVQNEKEMLRQLVGECARSRCKVKMS